MNNPYDATHQPKSEAIDQHAANKLLYAEDCKHSSKPWQWWEWLHTETGEYNDATRQMFFDGSLFFRRKLDAPVWRKPVDITGLLTKYMKPKSKYGHIKCGDRVICNDKQRGNYEKTNKRI
jgi:hypothetical protein